MRRILGNRAVMELIAAVNVAGLVGGLFWYAGQLAATPLPLWPVVPDCPLAAGFAAWALMRRLRGRPSPFWDALAWGSSIKYGLWTVVIIGHSWLAGVGVTAASSLLFWSHVGMFVQGLVYGAGLWRVRLRYLALPAAWFIINDLADYVLGAHPYLPLPDYVSLAMILAGLTTVLSLCVLYLAAPEVSGRRQNRRRG